MSGVKFVAVTPFSVGQNASLDDAISALYFEPTLEPERTTPPGNGMMTPAILRMAATPHSAAASALFRDRARMSRLPPPTAFVLT